MKKLATLIFASVFCLSIMFLAGSSAAARANSVGAPGQVVPETKRVTRKVYGRSKHITVKTWHKTKHYTKKGWHKSKHWGRKVVVKTKHVMVGKPRRRP